jgi:hypothetical protein
MGNHGGASTRLRAREADERAKTSTASRPRGSRAFTLRNWVARDLVARAQVLQRGAERAENRTPHAEEGTDR